MARPKKYTAKRLREQVGRYFDSISRIVTMQEKRDTGQKDSNGHIIWETVDIINNLDEPMRVREFILPPTVGGLCEYLGIHRSTWNDYCNADLHPEFSDTTTRARGRMREYLESQLLTRKDVKGIIFDLQNNYGYTDRREVEIGSETKKLMALQSMTPERREKILEELLSQETEADD